MTHTQPDSTKLSQGMQALRQLVGALHMAEQEHEAAEQDAKMVRRSFGISVKSVDEAGRTVRVVASSTAIDSYGEIVEQDWDLSRYEANPVVLYRHNQPTGFLGGLTAEETLPIGHATDVEVVDGQLEATLHFVTAEATPLAEQVFQGFVQKSLRAVSVGFEPGDIREEQRDGKPVFVLSKNKLYEISAVPMGANPEAVAKSAEHNRAQLRRLMTTPAQSGPENETEESQMDQKQIEALQAELATAKADAKSVSEKLTAETEVREAAEAKVVELEKQVGDLTAERDLAHARAEKADEANITHEVDALVGKKIVPAERDAMIELRKEKPELFAKLMESRGELGLSSPALKSDKEPQNTVAEGGVSASRLGDSTAEEAEASVYGK